MSEVQHPPKTLTPKTSAPLAPRPSHPALYLSNLPHSIAAAQIADAFHEHAKVEVAHVELLLKGHGTCKKTCGLGIVTLSNPDLAYHEHIMRIMDGKVIMGRPMIVRTDKFEEDDFAYDPLTHKHSSEPVATPISPTGPRAQAAH